jgi:hypothetical protein
VLELTTASAGSLYGRCSAEASFAEEMIMLIINMVATLVMIGLLVAATVRRQPQSYWGLFMSTVGLGAVGFGLRAYYHFRPDAAVRLLGDLAWTVGFLLLLVMVLVKARIERDSHNPQQ